MPVLVVGSIALDTLRMPDGKQYDGVLGGSCSYFIHSGRYFSRVQVVSVVGQDFPKKFVKGFEQSKADLEGLQMVPGETFQWHGTYMKDMNERVSDATLFGVLGQFNPILPPKYRKTKYVFLACSQPELQSRVLDQMEGAPFAVCDTIEYYIKETRPALDKLIRRCQGMIINDTEARMLTGEHNLVAAANAMVKKYKLRFLVLKKGEHGGMLVSKDGIAPFPAYPLARIVDPTGAGDSFAGGFVSTLAKLDRVDGKALRQAVVNATSVASFTCEGLGMAGIARRTPAEVRARAAAFVKMTRLG